MSEQKGLPEGKVVRAGRWGLLGCWYCVPVDLSEDEIVKQLLDGVGAPVTDPALIKDRCYGGFFCEREDRRHVYFNAGQYTYVNPENNKPLDRMDRARSWAKLLEQNPGQFLGDGPFTADSPAKKLKEVTR